MISEDNKYLVTGADDYSVTVYDLQMKHIIHSINKAHQGKKTSHIVFSNNSRTFILRCCVTKQ